MPHEEGLSEGPGILASIWRDRLLVAAVTVLAAAAGYGLSLLGVPAYQATAQVFLSDPSSASVFADQQPYVENTAYTAQQVLLFGSQTVQERASDLLDGRLSPRELGEQVEATAVEQGSLLVEVAVTDGSVEDALESADAVVRAYGEVVTEHYEARAEQAAAQLDPQRADLTRRIADLQQQLVGNPGSQVAQSQIEALSDQLLALENQALELRANAGAFGDGIAVAEPAVAPLDPVSPKPLRNAVLLGALGAGLASALAYWRAGRAREVATRDDPAQILGAPLLGEIPGHRRPADGNALALDAATAESYQFVLASIEFALEEIGGSSLLVTSAAAGDGKTTTAVQLAMAASRDGRKVVLVDTDVRAQGLTRMLRLGTRTGLTELAQDDLDVEDSVHYLAVTDEVLLPVVATGARVEDPSSFFRAAGFRKALQRLRNETELVLLDSSPLLAVADTSVVAGQVDGIVLVVDRSTRIEQLELLRQRLAFVSTPLLGYVFNRAPRSRLSAYGYGYGPHAGQERA